MQPAPSRPETEEDRMMFEETLYLRDDEADEFGDTGSYGDALEEDYEEEEGEEAEVPAVGESEPEPMDDEEEEPAREPVSSGGGGGGSRPARKPAKKAAKKK